MSSVSDHVAILGAGLIGLSTADALMRRGYRVTVIESGVAPLHGASFANSGMIHPSQACSWQGQANPSHIDEAVERLARRSRDLLLERMAELNLSDMRAHASGCYQLFDTEGDLHSVQARMQARGIEVDRVSPRLFGMDRPTLLYPEDHWGDAYQYGKALLADLLDRRITLLTGVQANLRPDSDGHGVDVWVDSEPFSCDHVVLATGVASTDLLAPLSLSLPIRPVRGWAVDFQRPETVSFPDIPVMDAQTRSALTPFSNRIRLSGTLGQTSPDLLIERWSTLVPVLSLQDKDFDLVWSGLRPACDLGRPVIGQSPIKTLWVNAGHGHMGWTLCAGSAEYLADCMTGEDPTAVFSYPLQS